MSLLRATHLHNTLADDVDEVEATRVTTKRRARVVNNSGSHAFAGMVFSVQTRWREEPMTLAEDAALVARCVYGCDDSLKALSLRVAPLIAIYADMVHKDHPTVMRDDLIGEGCLAMIQAVHTFDPKAETLFTTYCRFAILGAMRAFAVHHSCAVGAGRLRSWRRHYKDFVRACTKMEHALGQSPMNNPVHVRALAQRLDMPVQQVIAMHAFRTGNTETMAAAAHIATPNTFADDCHPLLVAAALHACHDATPKTKAIVRDLVQCDPLSYTQAFVRIAHDHNRTPERVRQLHRGMLQRMRDFLEKRGIRCLDDVLDPA